MTRGIISFFVLLTLVASGLAGTVSSGSQKTGARINQIRQAAEAIDKAADESPVSDRRLLTLPHLQISAFLPGGQPASVHVSVAEGTHVRDEQYYFKEGRLILVCVLEFEDGGDDDQKPETTELYFEGRRVIRQQVVVEGERRPQSIQEGPISGDAWLARSQLIAKIILNGKASPEERERLMVQP